MFFVCTVTDFSAAEKGSGVKLRMLVRLLSGMSFSHFDELWLARSHGGGITSGMSYTKNKTPRRTVTFREIDIARGKKFRGEAPWAVGIGGGAVA